MPTPEMDDLVVAGTIYNILLRFADAFTVFEASALMCAIEAFDADLYDAVKIQEPENETEDIDTPEYQPQAAVRDTDCCDI